MESLKDVHNAVRNTLYEWNYKQMDIVHIVDLGYALYLLLGKMSPVYKYHITCMCLNENLVDYGDGLYGICEEVST
jgi:hypothetical protein